jgi:dienelactone hydrolase
VNREDDVVRPRDHLKPALITVALILGLVVGGAPAHAVANPYERGPAPTNAGIEAARGPFAVAQAGVPLGTPGFGGGQIFWPTDTSHGTFGAVAISPGFLGTWDTISWMGPRIASQGFVVMMMNTATIFDPPPSRGDQLLAALDWAVTRSPAASRIDRTRLAVAGHSMGGGGSLEAAVDRPSLQAAVLLAPWSTTKNWSAVRTPTLVIGAENDAIAPVAEHAEPFYASIPDASEKAYLELNDADHLFPLFVANVTEAKYMITWLKRFVDNDTRYDQFLCPGPAPSGPVQEYRNTCPMA